MSSTSPRNRVSPVRALTVTAMLSAVAFVLMFLDFSIPMLIPAFVKMDISDLPELLAAFSLGPLYGAAVALLKNLLHILIKGTSTAGAGELCNFLFGTFFSVTAGVIYHGDKSRARAIVGAITGSVVMAIASVPINLFISYPAYEKWYGLPIAVIVDMYKAILPSVNSLLECLIIFNLPFTLVKGLLCSLICFFIYKPLSPILHGRR